MTIIILKRLDYRLSQTDKGRLTKETDPLGNEITYTYDTKGNLISKKDANGNTITYTYDSLNRLLKKKYPDTAEETFSYDAKGNILTGGELGSNLQTSFAEAARKSWGFASPIS
ncbi:MAG: RHS repeat protein [Deltaproteobacteria bacterium]|nr:RHS repeat protein [Deltaproteobacteria bacterium]